MPREITGFTPTRGRAADNVLHQLRAGQCDGRVIVAIVGGPGKEDADCRQKCYVCGMKTNHYCTGCKNYLCFGAAQGFTETRLDAVMAKSGHTLTVRPKPTIKMTSYDPKTSSWKRAYGKNCCYLLQHRHAFDTLWGQRNATEQEQEAIGGDE